MEMRERVPHFCPRILPIGGDRRSSDRRVAPVRSGPAKHAAQQTTVWAPFQQPCAVAAPRKIGDAIADRFQGFGDLSRQFGLQAERRVPNKALLKGKCRILGIFGVQMVAPRSMTACA